jgi:hypothetical protein
MATIQRNVKTYGTRSFVGEVSAAPSNYAPILSNEVDADLDTVYAAWNGGADSVNVKDGSITYAKFAPDARLWRDTGTTLTPGPDYTTRPLVLPASDTQVTAGSGVMKGVLSVNPNGDYYLLTNNRFIPDDLSKSSWNLYLSAGTDQFTIDRRAPGAGAGTSTTLLRLDGTPTLWLLRGTDGDALVCQTNASVRGHLGLTATPSFVMRLNANAAGSTTDDPSRPSWSIQLDSPGDGMSIWRAPATAGAPAFANKLLLTGLGDLQISGGTATKAAGTTWANPSDRRLKDEIADYATGLDVILQLQPRTFVYNGLGGSTPGLRGYGFIADEIAPIMPETVGTRAGKLDPADEEETDIQMLDQSNLILALVNATKELAARVAALEGPRA